VKLIRTDSNQLIEARVSKLTSVSDFKSQLLKTFSFDWEIEESNEIFRLENIRNNEILGLMSIKNISEEYRIHINLIESNALDRGKKKRIKNIPHCLISYACKQSFALGYDGFVSLYPKTELIDYYMREYGFEQFGRHLAIYGSKSFELIREFLDE
jgi:hypothetical protein